MTYLESCPQRAVIEIRHTIKTWLPVKLDCGHVEEINWTPRIGSKVGCTACERASKAVAV